MKNQSLTFGNPKPSKLVFSTNRTKKVIIKAEKIGDPFNMK